jgi:transposase
MQLMPPAYVKPYVKRQKNDSTDAEAICVTVTRPNMRFVPTKTVEQQSCLMLHRARHLFIRQQTAVINSIRVYLAEFGIVAPWAAGVSSNCWKSSPIHPSAGSPRWPARVLRLSAVNCAH